MKTDRQLQDVLHVLKREPAVDARSIGVEATDGVVQCVVDNLAVAD